MNIQVPVEELQKRKLMIATPMFAGQCTGIYTQSIINLAVRCAQYKIDMRLYYIFNESLIQRARNYSVAEFLRSDCTHLLFIDGDIGFDPDAALTLMALQSDESEYDVIAASYPKKCISWEKIKVAVEKGMADEDPNNLENYVGDYVFNIANGVTQIHLDEPVEVMETGTGFMMIRRQTLEKFMAAYPQQMYRPDHVRTEHFDGSKEICAFFDCVIDPVSKRYLSEDYMFCDWVRKAGMKVWLCPWIPLKHMGSYVFGGSLPALASIGASLTADTNLLKKIPSVFPEVSPKTSGKKK